MVTPRFEVRMTDGLGWLMIAGVIAVLTLIPSSSCTAQPSSIPWCGY